MEEMEFAIPQKVLECMDNEHHLIELKEGSSWYYACRDCHYVLEAHCMQTEDVLVSQS